MTYKGHDIIDIIWFAVGLYWIVLGCVFLNPSLIIAGISVTLLATEVLQQSAHIKQLEEEIRGLREYLG